MDKPKLPGRPRGLVPAGSANAIRRWRGAGRVQPSSLGWSAGRRRSLKSDVWTGEALCNIWPAGSSPAHPIDPGGSLMAEQGRVAIPSYRAGSTPAHQIVPAPERDYIRARLPVTGTLMQAVVGLDSWWVTRRTTRHEQPGPAGTWGAGGSPARLCLERMLACTCLWSSPPAAPGSESPPHGSQAHFESVVQWQDPCLQNRQWRFDPFPARLNIAP